MTEFEYDCYLKKSVAHSAMKRKCGSKSKKCSLPSDSISKRQWDERCGEVVSYQIGKPMTWREFGKLPKDLKEEYLNNLINKYSVNTKILADMFGVSVATVFRAVKNENLNVKFQKGKRPTELETEQFQKFLSGVAENADKNDDVSNEPAETDAKETTFISPDKEPEKSCLATRLDSFSMSFSGDIDIEMIANSLRYVLGQGRKAKILISCEIDNA